MASTRQSFDLQLRALEQRVLRMGSFVEGMLDDAVTALVEQDIELAKEVIRRDDVADEQDLDIEMTCMHLLALQQPMSKDLRMIGTAMKIITDLERIGDYSVDIAKTAIELSYAPHPFPLTRIPRMGDAASLLVREALKAFVSRDLQMMEEAIALDDEVDTLNMEVWHSMMEKMAVRPDVISWATHLILVARYLERIADHAVKVAERVYYMETGILKEMSESENWRG